ncbi:MAG: outer membrane lipoprotein-sorting protein [Polyangiaceae bacterium]|jgi:outer membrane lipoprotein-sorting protein
MTLLRNARGWRKLQAVLVLLGVVWASVAVGADGLQIFEEAFRRDSGYGDYKSSVTMILRERSGDSIVRKMELSNLEVQGEGNRTLVVFDNPPDVKGTTILTATHTSSDDQQWIYLPSFQRVKQISTASQTVAFMGSEFSYEDINSITIQLSKFTYTYVRDEAVEGVPCFVVQRTPKYDHSAYSREVVWLDAHEYLVRRIDYFDRDNKPFKTLTVEGYDKYLDRFERPKQMTMVNLQNGKSTVLQWERYRFQNGLKERDFDVSGLKK